MSTLGDLPAFYTGIVVRNDDPEKSSRVILKIPAALGNSTSAWAIPLQPTPYVPQVNEIVWVVFRDGEISKPLYLSAFMVSGNHILANTITAAHLDFVPLAEEDLDPLLQALIDANESIGEVQEVAEAKSTYFYGGLTTFGGAEPIAATSGASYWIDTDNDRLLKRWNGTNWVEADDARLAEAIDRLTNVEGEVDSKVQTYEGVAPPWPDFDPDHDENFNDLWFDTTGSTPTADPPVTRTVIKMWSTSRTWVPYQIGLGGVAPGAIQGTQIDNLHVETQRVFANMVSTVGLTLEKFEDLGAGPVRVTGQIAVSPEKSLGLFFYPLIQGTTTLRTDASFKIPMDPAQPLWYEGTVIAKEISVLDGATLRSLGNELSRGSRLTMAQGTTAPSQAPGLDATVATIQTTAISDNTDIDFYGLTKGPLGNWVTLKIDFTGITYTNYVHFYDPLTGALVKSFNQGGSVTHYGGIVYGTNPAASATTRNLATPSRTAGSTVVTSPFWATSDIGATLVGTGIPAGTIVQSVVAGTSATMSRPATVSATDNVSVTRTNKRFYALGLQYGQGWKITVWAPPDLGGTATSMPFINRVNVSSIPEVATYTLFDPALGWDWTSSRLIYGIPNVSDTGKVQARAVTFSAFDDVSSDTTFWTSGNNYNVPLQFLTRDAYDYGSTRIMYRTDSAPSVNDFRVCPDVNNSNSAGTDTWVPAGPEVDVRGAWLDGAASGLDRTMYHLGADGKIYRYERDGNMWTTDTNKTNVWEGALTYRDENAATTTTHPTAAPHNTCGGVHETSRGSKKQFTMKKRALITMSGFDLLNYNPTGDPAYEWQDDPNAFGFWLAKSVGGTMVRQATPGSTTKVPAAPAGQIPTLPVKDILIRNALSSGTTTVGVPFPDSTPGEIVANVGGFRIDAVSNGSIGTGTFRTSVDARVSVVDRPTRGCRYRRGTNQVGTADSTWAQSILGTKDFDSGAVQWNAGPTGGANAFTCPAGETGIYNILFRCLFAGNATGIRRAVLMKNSTATASTVGAYAGRIIASPGSGVAVVDVILNGHTINAGDYFLPWHWQNSTVNLGCGVSDELGTTEISFIRVGS